jgi:hypothetical protein
VEAPVDNDNPMLSLPKARPTVQSALYISPPQNRDPVPPDQGEINLDHMELLIHLSLEKDMFNLGFGIEEYHPSGMMLALGTSLKSPLLMHQLLAFSSRHLAYVPPERFTFYERQAVALQTRAISIFNATNTATGINQSNCVVVLLFASILGHHTLADALALRPPGGIHAFVEHYIQCIETHRGIYTIAKTAWPMLMESELEPILSLSLAFTSREPEGHHCQSAFGMVNESSDLDEEEKEACLSALRYLQVGMDAATSDQEESNRYHMICTWTMLLTPTFTRLLSSMRPEALVILAYYAEMLHHGRELWQVCGAGIYILGLIIDYLGADWCRWLDRPRKTVLGRINEPLDSTSRVER